MRAVQEEEAGDDGGLELGQKRREEGEMGQQVPQACYEFFRISPIKELGEKKKIKNRKEKEIGRAHV